MFWKCSVRNACQWPGRCRTAAPLVHVGTWKVSWLDRPAWGGQHGAGTYAQSLDGHRDSRVTFSERYPCRRGESRGQAYTVLGWEGGCLSRSLRVTRELVMRSLESGAPTAEPPTAPHPGGRCHPIGGCGEGTAWSSHSPNAPQLGAALALAAGPTCV